MAKLLKGPGTLLLSVALAAALGGIARARQAEA